MCVRQYSVTGRRGSLVKALIFYTLTAAVSNGNLVPRFSLMNVNTGQGVAVSNHLLWKSSF